MMDWDDLTARDLMSPEIRSIDSRETLRHAARSMKEYGIHCLMVPSTAKGRAPGIITCKDIVQILGNMSPGALDELQVHDAMTTPAITVQQHLAIADCINLMRMAGVRRVFVLDGAEPVGLLSFTDVLRAAAG